jgi:hypothetical protein
MNPFESSLRASQRLGVRRPFAAQETLNRLEHNVGLVYEAGVAGGRNE